MATRHIRFFLVPASAFLLLALALVFPSLARAQRGAIVLPQNLAELVADSGVILRGRVVSARLENHPDFRSLATVVVTLRVDETLKGSVGPTYTFRQYVWDIRDRENALGYRKAGEVLLLLISPSRIGLSSPAGLSQGRFRIRRDSEGRAFAVNGAGNAGLFRDFQVEVEDLGVQLTSGQASLVEQHQSGPVPLEQLESLIRTLVEAE